MSTQWLKMLQASCNSSASHLQQTSSVLNLCRQASTGEPYPCSLVWPAAGSQDLDRSMPAACSSQTLRLLLSSELSNTLI